MITRIAYCLIQLYNYINATITYIHNDTDDKLNNIIEKTDPSESFTDLSEPSISISDNNKCY